MTIMFKLPLSIIPLMCILYVPCLAKDTSASQVSSKNKILSDQLMTLVNATVKENEELKSKIKDLADSEAKLKQELQRAKEFSQFSGDWKEKYLELKESCEKEKEEALSLDVKAVQNELKSSLTECNRMIMGVERDVFKFKRRATRSENELKICQRELKQQQGKKEGSDSDKLYSILLHEEIDKILKIIKDTRHTANDSGKLEERNLLEMLRVIRKKITAQEDIAEISNKLLTKPE